MKAALVRGIMGAAIAGASAAIAWAAADPKYAVIAGIAGAMLTRFLVEGGYDTSRQSSNQVTSADVKVK